ncbi:MAG TPA: ATP-binding protein, partial [Actinopolymorphaceae bacterium]
MKIAFVGKGGSGTTTLTALFAAHLAELGRTHLVIDADINQHLAVALGADQGTADALPTLGSRLDLVKDYRRGDNPRIRSAAEMTKTTPAGSGSRLLRVAGDDPIASACVRQVGGVRLAVTGPFGDGDLGVACYHSKVGAVELVLNHLVDLEKEYVVVDMTAGADAFASGLFTRFDLTFLVCEPTVRSVGVHRQYTGYAADHDVRIAVVGNKIGTDPQERAADLEFLRREISDDLVT